MKEIKILPNRRYFLDSILLCYKTSITDEHRCKNPQQNFSKQNSPTHQKAPTPQFKSINSSVFSFVYQICKGKLTHIFLKLFKKLKKKEHFWTHSIRPGLPWYQKQTKVSQKRKLQSNIPDEHRCKNRQQNISKLCSTKH